jgi:site-specific DNA recombinase
MKTTKTKTTNRRRALIYCRVSSERQDEHGTSLHTQEKATKEYAKKHGYTVVDFVVEKFTGEYLYARPLLTECRKKMQAGAYDVMLIFAFDRLARNQGHTALFMDQLEKLGVELISVTEDTSSPEGQLIIMIKNYLAAAELEKIRGRSMRGKIEKLQEGKLFAPSCPLYGYTVNKATGKREIVESEAATVRRIYDYYVTGQSYRGICRLLNEDDIPSPSVGKRRLGTKPLWGTGMIRRILTNVAYIGTTYSLTTAHERFINDAGELKRRNLNREKKDWIKMPDGTTPAIITEDQFKAVAKRSASNVGTDTRNAKRPAMLRGLTYCTCGRKMYPKWSRPSPKKSRDGYVYFLYQCTAGYDPHPCKLSRNFFNGEKLEAAIWQKIVAILSEPSMIERELEARRQSGQHKILDREIATKRKDLAKIDTELRRLAERVSLVPASVFEILTAQMESKAKERDLIAEQLADAERDLDLLNNDFGEAVDLKAYAKIGPLLANLGYKERRAICEMMRIKVKGHKGEALMTFSLPPSPDALLEGRACLTSSVQSIDIHGTQLERPMARFSFGVSL